MLKEYPPEKVALLGRMLDQTMIETTGERFGFVLLAFPFTEITDGSYRTAYIANVDRETGIKLLKEQLEWWESGGPDGLTGTDMQ